MKTRFLILSLLFSITCYASIAQVKIEELNNPDLLKTAQAFPATGILRIDKHGYVYLKVADTFSSKLYALLTKDLPSAETSCLQPARNRVGDHISLFYENNLTAEQLQQLPRNKIFPFKITKVKKVMLTKEVKQTITHNIWYVLGIESSEIKRLVEKFPSKNEASRPDLHISVALTKRDAQGHCKLKPL